MKYDDELISFEVIGDTVIAKIDGEIDHHRAKRLREAVDGRIYADRPACFMADMSGVTFMDSSGLGLILGRFTLCRELGIDFKLCSPSDEVMKIIDLAGAGRLIRIERRAGDKLSKGERRSK